MHARQPTPDTQAATPAQAQLARDILTSTDAIARTLEGLREQAARLADAPAPAPPAITPALLSFEEAATYLGVGRTTIYQLVDARALQSVRIGRSVRIRRDELDRHVDALTTTSESA